MRPHPRLRHPRNRTRHPRRGRARPHPHTRRPVGQRPRPRPHLRPSPARRPRRAHTRPGSDPSDRGAVTVEILFVRTDPVQEIAAEPATLDLLKDILRPKDAEPRATPELLAAARSCGWPLVYDEALRPGIVHCRPTLGADPPPT